ncbi:inorganic phosphate transporter [Aurantiacibacter sp. D1-12]|uniref:inorganic phosphate transporter n=1 Tax=Aurantiacibacter sp. D1-12 TaxID=2993658 RepID=UPI00237C74FA|nr:inorganic phosphate transporter [Aurantiacibacter sp. D1-12]MDE1467828.1 inorganic phosphate transporter [Aurantiacibacter sp. D1-12]
MLLGFAALFLAFSNGANDNFKGFATIWGSKTLPYRRALLLATIATVLGGLASVVLAEGLVSQFSGKGLVGDDLAGQPRFALAVASGAAATVILATRLGFPISTTHALVGGLVGAGVALSEEAINLGNLGSGFVVPLLVSPFMSAGLGLVFYWLLKRFKRSHPGAKPAETPIARGLHLLSATSICFARGVNDAPKLAALLVGTQLLDESLAALGVTVAMGIGGWLLSRRVAETMSHKINRLDHAQGTTANLVTAGLVLGASRFGLPVSTTHVSVGSIIGTGASAGTLDLKVVRNVLGSWVLTLPTSAVIALGVGLLIQS